MGFDWVIWPFLSQSLWYRGRKMKKQTKNNTLVRLSKPDSQEQGSNGFVKILSTVPKKFWMLSSNQKTVLFCIHLA